MVINGRRKLRNPVSHNHKHHHHHHHHNHHHHHHQEKDAVEKKSDKMYALSPSHCGEICLLEQRQRLGLMHRPPGPHPAIQIAVTHVRVRQSVKTVNSSYNTTHCWNHTSKLCSQWKPSTAATALHIAATTRQSQAVSQNHQQQLQQYNHTSKSGSRSKPSTAVEWMNENLYIAHKKTSTQNLACSQRQLQQERRQQYDRPIRSHYTGGEWRRAVAKLTHRDLTKTGPAVCSPGWGWTMHICMHYRRCAKLKRQ